VRNGCLAFTLALATSGTASAQQLRPGSIATAVRSAPALSEPAEPPRAAPPGADRRIVIATGDDPRDDSARIANQILQHLPLGRVQHLLRTNPMLRAAEVAVGASLVGYQFCQSSSPGAAAPGTSPLAQVGVQALRYGGAEWLERRRFRIEPDVRPGGFAVYLKRTH
jgi:hypothetical protein